MSTKTQDQARPKQGSGNASSSAPDREIVGDKLGGTIEVEYRLRVPHPGARRRQREEYPMLVEQALRRKAERDGVELDPRDVEREVQRSLADVARRRLDIGRALDEVAPQSAACPASTVNRDVEAAAILRLPQMLWAWFRLILYACGPKDMPMWRRLAAAVGMHMGFTAVKPCAARILERFCGKLSMEAWQHRYPGEPPTYRDAESGKWDLSAFHKQLKLIFGRRNPYTMWQAVNREVILQLLGEHTVDARHGGRFANYPDALKYLLVDAVLIEADLPQHKPVSDEHAKLVRGEARARCGFVIYKHAGQVSRKCHGYKWLQVSSLLMGGLVLHGRLLPANCNERAETLKLLDELFLLWPELRAQKDIVLVGDALYDQSEDFAYELVFRFGIHPCFVRAGTIGREYQWAKTQGVPRCGCGDLAVLDEADKFPTPHYRRTHGLPDAGQWILKPNGEVVDNARIRWKCAHNVPGCKAPDTYPRENPRLYTWLPYDGNHHRAALRTALYAYRNVIEASFSNLKDMGLAGKDQARPRWAGDDQMDHLCWMAVTTMSARRVAHANGLYEQVYDEATNAGLLEAATETNRAGLPDMTEPEAVAWRHAWKRWAKAPAGWPELDPDNDAFHEPTTGQLRFSLAESM